MAYDKALQPGSSPGLRSPRKIGAMGPLWRQRLPEMDRGSVPAWGGSARLTRLVGPSHALDMILRAKKISGAEALRIGLVHEVWPVAEIFDRAQALGRELAAQPARSVAAMLRCIVDAHERTLAENLAAEREAVHATSGTPDQIEGYRAFLQKRRPRFNRELDE